ncbi:MAG: hypothetical protein K9I84_12535 [Leadbetterella sp.]|nr:hypothetical protein [Leadbetterella sp.]
MQSLKHYKRHYKEKGTALFLILIAVVLFAAITYAVTQSNNGNAVSMSREVADTKATELVSYANLIRDAINKLLLRGCDETEITYQNMYFTHVNASSPSDGRCHIFHPNGGGLTPRLFSDDYLDSTQVDPIYDNHRGEMGINGRNRIQYMGTDSNGVASTDVLGIFTPVHPEICKAINRRYNINPPSYTPPTTGFYGTWISNIIGTIDGGLRTTMSGLLKGGGCYFVNQYGGYTSYFVPLLER